MFGYDSKDGVVFVPESPDWIVDDGHLEKYWDCLQGLIVFYIFRCVVPGCSNHRISLERFGWDKPWRKPQKLSYKLKGVSSNHCLYWSASRYGDIEKQLVNSGLAEIDYRASNLKEGAVFFDSRKNQTLSLFVHIRNSLAHGRFYCFESVEKERWIVFEDVSQRRGKDPAGVKRLSARILLKVKTLYSWIDLIKRGPQNE